MDLGDREVNELDAREEGTRATTANHQEDSRMASIPPLMLAQMVDEVVGGQQNMNVDQDFQRFFNEMPDLMRHYLRVVNQHRPVYYAWREEPQNTVHPRQGHSTHRVLHLRYWEGAQQDSTSEVRQARDGQHGLGQDDHIEVDRPIPEFGQGNVSKAA